MVIYLVKIGYEFCKISARNFSEVFLTISIIFQHKIVQSAVKLLLPSNSSIQDKRTPRYEDPE